jgi:chromate reductase, NAD(P)H dehydrogenase (quinone)
LTRILAISGSLRSSSSNTALLQAVAALAPEEVHVVVYLGLSGLPHFNPDLDTENPPPAVRDLRSQLLASDGVLISSPEYAHGVPGVMKNALDWLVRSGELYEKPVALINASPRANHAQASLVETLTTMTARLVPEACVTVPLQGKNLDASGICSDLEISRTLRLAITVLARSTAPVTGS